jgi:putative endonuclease
MYFTYILFSVTKNKYYIGSCQDVHRRLERHNAGATISTKNGRPWIIVYTEMYNTKTEAICREIQIKK